MFKRIKTLATLFPAAVLLVPALVLVPITVEAQEAKPARIGVLRPTSPPPHYLEQFRKGLRERGHVEGKSFILVPGWGKGRDKTSALAAKLAARSVDVIVTVGTSATRAAHKAAPSTPIVFASSGAPVRAGLVRSLSAPGGNITGLMSGSVELAGKSMEVLKELVPGLRRFAYVVDRRARSRGRGISKIFREAYDHAAQTLGITSVQELPLRKGETYDEVFARATKIGIEGVHVRSTQRLTPNARKRLVRAAAKFQIPAVYRSSDYVKIGGLVSYASDRGDQYRRAAIYVDKILKGAKPADLPVERPSKFDLVINLKTAKALGITVPRSLLLRANEVIE